MTRGLMDVYDVAEALRVSPHTIRRWATQKKLRRIKLGSRTLFDPIDVAQFVERARADAEPTQSVIVQNRRGNGL